MVWTGRILLALAVAGIFAAPLAADVIPSRYASKSGDKDAVQARLTRMGLAPGEAQARATRLTDEDASYLARNPDRVQIVGQEMWGGQSDNLYWEWGVGAATLIGTLILILVIKD